MSGVWVVCPGDGVAHLVVAGRGSPLGVSRASCGQVLGAAGVGGPEGDSRRVACQTCVVVELVSARCADLAPGGSAALVGDRPRWVRDPGRELVHLVAPEQFAASVGGAIGRALCGRPVAGMDASGLGSGLCVRCVSALLAHSEGRV